MKTTSVFARKIVTRAEARVAGLKRYYSGEPCKRGHLCERHVIGGRCLECSREDSRRLAREHPEKKKEYGKRHRERYPERQKARSSKRWQQHGEKIKAYARKKYAEKRERLANRPRPQVCDACGRPSKPWLCFDHDHATGAFRGWLCVKCNTILGYADDAPGILRALADYLDSAKKEGAA